MTLVIRIDMDNAAFEDMPVTTALRIIRGINPCSLADEGDKINLRDSNGNTVGYAEVTDD